MTSFAQAGVALCCGLALACTDESIVPIVPDADAGWEALADWDAIPVLGSSRHAVISSYERPDRAPFPLIQPGNKDFNNFVAVCGERPETLFQNSDGAACAPGIEGYVIAEAAGPGFVSRFHMTAGAIEGTHLERGFVDETIRIYVDSLDAPAYEGRVADLGTEFGAPFSPPIAAQYGPAVVSYLPISYASRLLVVLDQLRPNALHYYQFDTQSVARTERFDAGVLAGKVARLRWDSPEQFRKDDRNTLWVDERRAVPAAGTEQFLEREGSGTLRMLRLSVPNARAASDLRLRVTWDDERVPAVDVPLDSLFGIRQSQAPFQTLGMSVRVTEELELTLWLPMPHTSRAAIELANSGTEERSVRVRAEGIAGVPRADWGRLHAFPNTSREPLPEGSKHLVANARGRGKYVGTLLLARGRSDAGGAFPDPMNFLEGDDIAIVDGERHQGTGTEDYFNGAFYFPTGPFESPLAALIAQSIDAAESSAAVTMLRWHLLSDATSFQDSFWLQFEYGPDRPQTLIEYDSVAFYYSK
jgi:hypothetical protein